MVFHETFNDDDKKITKGCLDAVNAGVDIIIYLIDGHARAVVSEVINDEQRK